MFRSCNKWFLTILNEFRSPAKSSIDSVDITIFCYKGNLSAVIPFLTTTSRKITFNFPVMFSQPFVQTMLLDKTQAKDVTF